MPTFKFPKIKFKRPTFGGVLYWVIAIGLGVAALIFARGFIACWNITDLPGRIPAACYGSLGEPGEVLFNPKGTAIATVPLTTPVPS